MSEPMSPEEKCTEANKLLHDTLKQLVTISSASILILIAIMEKLFATSLQWKWLIVFAKCLMGFSFAGFFACIYFSLSLMKHISLNVTADPESLPDEEKLKYKLAKRSFISAVFVLVVFMIGNLFLR